MKKYGLIGGVIMRHAIVWIACTAFIASVIEGADLYRAWKTAVETETTGVSFQNLLTVFGVRDCSLHMFTMMILVMFGVCFDTGNKLERVFLRFGPSVKEIFGCQAVCAIFGLGIFWVFQWIPVAVLSWYSTGNAFLGALYMSDHWLNIAVACIVGGTAAAYSAFWKRREKNYAGLYAGVVLGRLALFGNLSPGSSGIIFSICFVFLIAGIRHISRKGEEKDACN